MLLKIFKIVNLKDFKQIKHSSRDTNIFIDFINIFIYCILLSKIFSQRSRQKDITNITLGMHYSSKDTYIFIYFIRFISKRFSHGGL